MGLEDLKKQAEEGLEKAKETFGEENVEKAVEAAKDKATEGVKAAFIEGHHKPMVVEGDAGALGAEAVDPFMSAYMINGTDVFEGGEKYLTFLGAHMPLGSEALLHQA